MKKRRSGHNNTKRRICANPNGEDLARLSQMISYGGNPEHKRDPGSYQLNPPSVPRLDKTLCDPIGIRHPKEAAAILRQGIMKGLISEQHRGEFPQNIWSVHVSGESTWVIEGQLENQLQGVYHAYPLLAEDPFRLVVLERWNEEPGRGTAD